MRIRHIYKNYPQFPEKDWKLRYVWDYTGDKTGFLKKPNLLTEYYGWVWGLFVRRDDRRWHRIS